MIRQSTRRAFTLIELLAVIGIIGVMAAVIGLSLRGGGTAAIGNAQRIAASTFQSARSLAVLKNASTGVIIYGNQGANTDSGKYLRFMQPVYLADLDNDEATAPEWVANGQGTYLPGGVYFIPPTAAEISLHSNSVASTDLAFSTPASAVTSLDIRTVANESAPTMTIRGMFYTFNSNGTSNDPGEKIVLMAGTIGAPGAAGTPPELIIDNQYAMAGFYLRRLGTTTLAERDDLVN